MTKRRAILLAALPMVGLGVPPAALLAAEQVPFDSELLLSWNQDWRVPHEASPAGVPRGYDWAKSGRIRAGNNAPSGFKALTGWGQAFWSGDASSHTSFLEIRNHQLLVCIEPDRHWERRQKGAVAGAAFRPDFANNEAKAPPEFTQDEAFATLRFAPGSAYHFWPRSGRTDVPESGLCGLVVAVEARATQAFGAISATDDTGLLIGLGADFWQSRTAAWSNYKTNTDVGVSRLKRVTPEWRWYGMSTASDADLRQLAAQGFTDKLKR